MNIDTFGIHEIIINMQSNIPENTSFELTSDVYYLPNDNGSYNKYPFFTDRIRYPSSITNKSPNQIKELFFNKSIFEREIIGNNVNINNSLSVNEKQDNANYNIQIFISSMMPISFPVKNNYHTTFDEKIKQGLPHFKSSKSWSSYLFGSKEAFSYMKQGDDIYTFIEVTWINDVINNSQYRKLFRQLFVYQNWLKQQIEMSKKEMNSSKKKFITDYPEFITALRNTNTFSEIITVNNKRRIVKGVLPEKMNPILEKINTNANANITEKNADEIMNLFFELRKMELNAQKLNSDPIFIPTQLENLSTFRKLLIYVKKYYYNHELIKYLDNLPDFIKLIQKPADEITNQWEHYIQKQLKLIVQVPQIMEVIKKYRKPVTNKDKETVKNYQYVTNPKLQSILDKFGETQSNESIQQITDFMSNLTSNNTTTDIDLNILNTGIIIDVQNKTVQETKTDEKTKDALGDIFGLNTKIFYKTNFSVNFVKGMLTSESIQSVKCEYLNNELIRMYETLRAPKKNIYLVYNIPLIDINTMTKQQNKQKQKQKQKQNKTRKREQKIQKGGYNPEKSLSIKRKTIRGTHKKKE